MGTPQAMDTIFVFWSYFYALITVLVLNCLHPANWKSCFTTNWLMPYLNDYIEFRMLPPYDSERRVLTSVKKQLQSDGVDQQGTDDP